MPSSSTRRAARARQRDHLLEIVAGVVERQAAQAVVGAELEHHDARLLQLAARAAAAPAPPAVVSPLTLAFTTRNPYPNCEIFCASRLTQPCSTRMP